MYNIVNTVSKQTKSSGLHLYSLSALLKQGQIDAFKGF